MEKLPSTSVLHPFCVPSSIMETPIRGNLDSVSKTVPTTFFCASALIDKQISANSNVLILFIHLLYSLKLILVVNLILHIKLDTLITSIPFN